VDECKPLGGGEAGVQCIAVPVRGRVGEVGRGLHSFPFELNLSRF